MLYCILSKCFLFMFYIESTSLIRSPIDFKSFNIGIIIGGVPVRCHTLNLNYVCGAQSDAVSPLEWVNNRVPVGFYDSSGFEKYT